MSDSSPSPETQEFLSHAADEMEAAAANLESNGGSTSPSGVVQSAGCATLAFGRKVVYSSCYLLSYGVCFPIFVACRYVPRNNQFVNGLVDGTEAAKQAVDDYAQRAEDRRQARQQKSLEDAAVSLRGTEALAPG